MSTRWAALVTSCGVFLSAGCGRGNADKPPVSAASSAEERAVTLHVAGMRERLKLT